MYVTILYDDEIKNVFSYTIKLSICCDAMFHYIHMSVNHLFNGRTHVWFPSCPKYIPLDQQWSCMNSGHQT